MAKPTPTPNPSPNPNPNKNPLQAFEKAWTDWLKAQSQTIFQIPLDPSLGATAVAPIPVGDVYPGLVVGKQMAAGGSVKFMILSVETDGVIVTPFSPVDEQALTEEVVAEDGVLQTWNTRKAPEAKILGMSYVKTLPTSNDLFKGWRMFQYLQGMGSLEKGDLHRLPAFDPQKDPLRKDYVKRSRDRVNSALS